MTDHRVRVLVGDDVVGAELVERLDHGGVEIILERPSFSRQVLVLSLVELLARLVPCIVARFERNLSADERLPPGPASFEERVHAVRERGGLLLAESSKVTLRIGVGTDKPADLYVDGDGFQSYIGRSPSMLDGSESPVVFGALASSARACAHSVAEIIGYPHTVPGGIYSSTIDYRCAASPMKLDASDQLRLNALLVGAGSEGGAAVYAWSFHQGLTGELDIVDPEFLEDGNLVKAVLASSLACDRRATKVEVAHAALEHIEGLLVSPHRCRVSKYRASLAPMQPLPTVLCCVDNPESRREIQECLPLRLVNAACHTDQVTVSRHMTGEGPCVCCLQIGELLDASRTRANMIARETGLPFESVLLLLVKGLPMDRRQLEQIAKYRGEVFDSFAEYEGRSLDALWRSRMLYAETRVRTERGVGAVAAPYVTALAGFLLAVEATRPSTRMNVFGPAAEALKYEEFVYGSPGNALLTKPERWPTSECLCRSTRRSRLTEEMYSPGFAV